MKNHKTKVYAVWISDTHFGVKHSKPGMLADFLKSLDLDVLHYVFLNGDIIDLWVLNHWDPDVFKVFQILSKMAKKGIKIIYTPGNHDEDFRDHLPFQMGSVEVVDEYIYERWDDKKFLVLHGDKFDSALYSIRWLAKLGSHVYDALLWMNDRVNWFRRKLGLHYWSFSAYMKRKTKGAQGVLKDFNRSAVAYAKRKGCDGVIVGHVHTAEITEYPEGIYLNSGDWIESCTAIVETEDGEMKIVTWQSK
jgi:UDP-2,3-diacylglucosamine pyrophosphatase LpxH